jgi:hypothetical protein
MDRARVFLAGTMTAVLVIGLASSGRAMSEREMELRQKLGIPAEARQVIVFAQSSHWDPDWMATADQYQKLATDRAIKNALIELEKDPDYVYSVECIFFFKRFWDSHPDQQAALRDYANQGRIRFTGGGVTTPDTLLPEPENLIRDYLVGREWLRQVGIHADPKLAYLPDCFGHSPSWPSILREMGYKYTAFARVDGMYSIGSDNRPRDEFPFPGSSAEILEREKTADFIWEAPAAVQWSRSGSILVVENEFYRIELDENLGGCITSWKDKSTDRETLAGPSNDLVLYEDSGDLWRMGHEFYRRKFRDLDRSCRHPVRLEARLEYNVLAVSAALEMEKREFVKTLYFRGDSPAPRMRLKGSVKKGRTATIRFMPALKPGRFIQEIPYGVVERPIVKNYDPTFWPAKNWVDLTDASNRFGMNLALSALAAVCARPDGQLELVVLRNTPWKRVFGIMTPSLPNTGKYSDKQDVIYGAWPHGPESWLERRVFLTAASLLDDSWLDPQIPNWPAFAVAQVETDSSEVIVTAVKKAEDGNGYVVRLFKYSEDPVFVRLRLPSPPKQAWLSDGLERRLSEIPIKDGCIELTMPYGLATVLVTY